MIQPVFPEQPVTDVNAPSLFDLLAQEQLRDLFHPVLRYILSYLAQRYPRYFLRLLNHHEETFALLLLIVEKHHLERHNASVSEHFYGLRLVPSRAFISPRLDSLSQAQLINSPLATNLTRKQRWGILIFIVGLPYVRARAQDYFERLSGIENDEIQLDEDGEASIQSLSKSQHIFKLLYPYLNLLLDISFLGYDIAYLFSKIPYWRPWYRLLNLRITRPLFLSPPSPLHTTTSSSRSALSSLSLPPLLPPLLLTLKLSQWWYSPSSPRALSPLSRSGSGLQGGRGGISVAEVHKSILPPRAVNILSSLSLFPFSQTQNKSHADDDEQEYKRKGERTEIHIPPAKFGICPLCNKAWANPAILPSGWVICWKCGWDAVEDDKECDDEHSKDKPREEEEVSEREEEGISYEAEKSTDGTEKKMKRKGRCPITGIYVPPGGLRRVLV
ncbi:peroxin-12 [Cryptococcus neoformans Tu401-1]|nr:peroxin-12 [Cryptococcus neoformans var. grubii Bt85]OXG19362.1 peroxin-12 [Cryptococcus neoformans var. grubii Tu401-1]OXM79869.1 peroxin-12 [Cryptococcus neoformans var. grubii Bt63]